jgi:hypothetical protein
MFAAILSKVHCTKSSCRSFSVSFGFFPIYWALHRSFGHFHPFVSQFSDDLVTWDIRLTGIDGASNAQKLQKVPQTRIRDFKWSRVNLAIHEGACSLTSFTFHIIFDFPFIQAPSGDFHSSARN